MHIYDELQFFVCILVSKSALKKHKRKQTKMQFVPNYMNCFQFGVFCVSSFLSKGYFHSTISIHSFRMGFLRPRQKSARTGRSGCVLPPRRIGRFDGAGVVDCAPPAMAVAVVDGAGPPAIPPIPRVSMPPLVVPL